MVKLVVPSVELFGEVVVPSLHHQPVNTSCLDHLLECASCWGVDYVPGRTWLAYCDQRQAFHAGLL